MPLKIIRDANNYPRAVYTPDSFDSRRESPNPIRPHGSIGYNPVTGTHYARPFIVPRHYVGLDLGQASDYTALTVPAPSHVDADAD